MTALNCGDSISLRYDTYEQWSGRSYYGRRSGAKRVPVRKDAIIEKASEKAVQVKILLTTGNEYLLWLPKSVMTESKNEENKKEFAVNSGFCFMHQDKFKK